MSEEFTEELALLEACQSIRQTGCSPDGIVVDSRSTFSFRLHRKETQLGNVRIDQFWMDNRGLYNDGRKRSANHKAVIDYFWALCQKHLTITDEAVQESYLLVHLLPHARKKGSRRVFYDAGQWHSKKDGLDKTKLKKWLEKFLQASKLEELTEIEFRNRTGDLFGPTMYSDDVWEVYHRVADDVLLAGRRAMEADGEEEGKRVTFNAWDKKMRGLGRRRGHQTEKLVLDVLSYEARAAFHRCYSAVWYDLIPHLADKYDLSDEAAVFHKMWHLDIQREAEGTAAANFHLFHGSILGLHPASRTFMLTDTGPALFGDWLGDPQCVTKYQRLLHGLFVAFHQYAERQETYAQSRKKESNGTSVADWTTFDEHLVDSRSGRKRSGRREKDAR